MEGKIYEIPLDISSGVLTAQIRELVTEDMGTNTFRIKLVKNKHVPFPLAGTIVRMMVKTPSGARIQQECTIENAVGGTVSLTLKQSLLLEHGSYIAELQIFDAITQSIRLTTPTFAYHVRESLQNSESIVATDEYTILQEALADLAGINIVVANKADKDYVDGLNETLVSQLNEIDANKVGWKLLNNVDLNTIFISTEGYCNNCVNSPSIQNGYFKSITFNATSDSNAYVYQSYVEHNTGAKYERVCNNKVWTPWKLTATTDKIDVLCTPLTGFKILSQSNYKINNVLYVTLTVAKTDDTPLPTGINCAVVPVGLRPSINTPISSTNFNDSEGRYYDGSAIVSTSGLVTALGIHSTATRAIISGSFVL